MSHKKKYRKPLECPNCKRTGCFEHCWKCGVPIKWKDEQGDPRYENYKRTTFNHDYSVHKCEKENNKKEKKYYNLDGQVLYYYPAEPINIREYDYHQMNYPCMECGRDFNKLVYPLCPSCWKMECRECHDRVPWRSNKETYCVNCGNENRDAVHVWNSYFRKYGKPKNLYEGKSKE
jgi:hypothetical protein